MPLVQSPLLATLLLAAVSWPAAGESAAANDCPNLVIKGEWDVGIDCMLVFVVDHDTQKWEIHLTYDSVVNPLDCWQATVTTTDNLNFKLVNMAWDGDIQVGTRIELNLQAHFAAGTRPNLIAADMDGQDICGGGGVTTTTSTTASTAPATTPTTSTTVMATTTPPDEGDDCSSVVTVLETDAVQHTTDFAIHLTPTVNIESWMVEIKFRSDVDDVLSPLADVTGGGAVWQLANKPWDGALQAGQTLELTFTVRHLSSASCPPIVGVAFSGTNICSVGVASSQSTGAGTSTSTTPTSPTTTGSGYRPDHPAKYDYGAVLAESLLFYEAERSGKLPTDNRVPWRGDSALGDEVVGGYYDAGDHVKFGFPMAATATVLAWGGISFQQGYSKAGQLDWFTNCLRWATDYFIACHKAPTEFIGQIGDGYADHGYWGRPEEMTMARPSYRITADKPGSDLAGETAAALAAASIYFRNIGDASYADTCLAHARQLLDFADLHRDTYTNAIPAADFYNSWSGYKDEIIWAAAWVAKATGDAADAARAAQLYSELGAATANPTELSWDDKYSMVQLVMYDLTKEESYKTKATEFMTYVLNAPRTPKGLIWVGSSAWGSLRYASNFAMYAMQAANLGIMEAEAVAFAESQINYILGDGAGHSYVVGWGNSPPQKPHHRAASCPDRPAPCDWNNYNSPNPNPQVLHGALVGGPDANDNWYDDRGNFQTNEVANDYNAGFTSALAGLQQVFN